MNIDITTSQRTHEVAPEPKSEKGSDLLGDALLSGQTENVNRRYYKEKLFSELGLNEEPVEHNYDAAQILEQFDGSNWKSFLSLAREYIDDETIEALDQGLRAEKLKSGEKLSPKYYDLILGFKERVMAKVVGEASGLEEFQNQSIEERFKKSLAPETEDLAKIGLAQNAYLLEKASQGICAGRYRVVDGNLVAGEGDPESQKSLEGLGRETRQELAGEYQKEVERQILEAPDELIQKTEDFLFQAKEREQRYKYQENYALNALIKGEDFQVREAEQYESAEKYLEIYRAEKREQAKELAEVKVKLSETLAGINPLDFGKTDFFVIEAQTKLEECLAVVRENQAEKMLRSILRESISVKKYFDHFREEKYELSKKEKTDLVLETKAAFGGEINKRIGRRLDHEEAIIENFYQDSLSFRALLSLVLEQKEIIKEITALNEKLPTYEQVKKTSHLLSESNILSGAKDEAVVRGLDQFAAKHCQAYLDRFLASLEPEKRDIAEKEHEAYNPKIETKLSGVIQEPKMDILSPHALEKLREDRTEYLRAHAEKASLARIKKRVHHVYEHLIRRNWKKR